MRRRSALLSDLRSCVMYVNKSGMSLELPYTLACKSKNFGQKLAFNFSIRLIRGSGFRVAQYIRKFPKMVHKNPIRLIRGSTYTRVYTVLSVIRLILLLFGVWPRKYSIKLDVLQWQRND